MSTNKKYFWLKLKDNFFDSEEMKIIESQKNGMLYQNLYLRLCLLSLKTDGSLSFKNCIPYDITMLSTVLRIDIDTVKTGIEIFNKLGLIDTLDSGLMYMSDIESLIGRGSSEADRKVIFREKIKSQKMLEGGGRTSEKRPPEIELEIEKEIDTISFDSSEEKKEKTLVKREDLFNLFWSKYGKQVGKQNTIKQWNKLTEQERIKLLDSIDIYIEGGSRAVKFRKDPERYISSKTFEDYQKVSAHSPTNAFKELPVAK